jgi:hypothetical protein
MKFGVGVMHGYGVILLKGGLHQQAVFFFRFNFGI